MDTEAKLYGVSCKLRLLNASFLAINSNAQAIIGAKMLLEELCAEVDNACGSLASKASVKHKGNLIPFKGGVK